MKKQIQVRIYPNGKIEAKTIGVKGKHCVQYSSLLEQVLNARAVEMMCPRLPYHSFVEKAAGFHSCIIGVEVIENAERFS